MSDYGTFCQTFISIRSFEYVIFFVSKLCFLRSSIEEIPQPNRSYCIIMEQESGKSIICDQKKWIGQELRKEEPSIVHFLTKAFFSWLQKHSFWRHLTIFETLYTFFLQFFPYCVEGFALAIAIWFLHQNILLLRPSMMSVL